MLSGDFALEFFRDEGLAFSDVTIEGMCMGMAAVGWDSIHLSRSTHLRKTLTVNHYLRIEYFQQDVLEIARLWPHLMRDAPVRNVLVRDVPALEGRSSIRTHQ